LPIGCGEDGKDGPPGPTGPAGPAAVEPETCIICHGAGNSADIAVAHPDPAGENVIISDITLKNGGVDGGVPVVSFHLVTDSGTPVTDLDAGLDVDNFQFMMADLVPAGTDTQGGWGTWDSPYWERWTYERTPTSSTAYQQGTLVNNQDGSYTYTFATKFGSAEALADAPDYDPTHPQRLYISFDGRPDYPNISVESLDFAIPAANGSTATVLPPQRQFVTGEVCKKCHGPNFERAAHADDYRDTRACVICHGPLGFDNLQTDPVEQNCGQFMQDTDAYASVFFHKIHGAIDIPYWTDMGRINGLGYSAVTYPQDIKDCVVCHNNDSRLELGDQADQIDKWKTHPTAEICGSCHVGEAGDQDIICSRDD
jgi:OmcA/MtrC family decaheme c-type cytochrome